MVSADDYRHVQASSPWTVYTNTIVSSNIVTSLNLTNVQDTSFCTYHTFQAFYTIIGTNDVAGSNVFDSTIDGANWVPEQTNSFATNASVQFTFVGKKSLVRSRLYTATRATNVNWNLLYMGSN